MHISEIFNPTTMKSPFAPIPTRRCERCGKDYLPPYPASRLCPKCQTADDEKTARIEQEYLATIRREAWKRLIPSEYSKTIVSQLPRQDLFNRVMGWTYGAQGMILHGPTGLGKSRSAYKLCEREFMAGRTLAAINASYCMGIPRLHREDWAEKEFDRFADMQIVLFDDVFKSKFVERTEEFLCTLIEERTARERPCIFTTNDTGPSLIHRMSSDRGEPLLRRIREFCDPIQFK